MCQSKISPLLGKESKTVPGKEEQSSRVSSWWALVFIILCTITTILDKRTPVPSMASMEPRGDNPKENRVGSKRSFEKLIQSLKSAQFWGNFSLILIQVVLFAMLQLAEYYDKVGGGCLVVSTLFVLLVVGVVLFIVTARVDFPSIIFLVQGLVLTIAILNFGRPDSTENSGASTAEQPGAGENGLSWILFLIVFQTVNLGLAWWASTKIKRTPESNSGAIENAQTEAQLTRRARIYSWINLIVSLLGASISAVPILEISNNPSMGTAERIGNGFMAFISLAGFVIFMSRFCWMRRARNYGYQVTDNLDDYSLERTTFLAWLLLFIVLTVQYCTDRNISDLGLETVGGWIIALAFWTPIVSIVGSSLGKLNAINPNGDKAVWPCRWSK